MITRKEWTIVPKCMTEMIDMSSFEKAWSIIKRNDGRNCRECRKRLEDDEFDAPFSWSYTCDDCGHRYKHGEDDPYE